VQPPLNCHTPGHHLTEVTRRFTVPGGDDVLAVDDFTFDVSSGGFVASWAHLVAENHLATHGRRP